MSSKAASSYYIKKKNYIIQYNTMQYKYMKEKYESDIDADAVENHSVLLYLF